MGLEGYPIDETGAGAATPVTVTDETGSIPGSRQLVNGTNSTVNISTAGEIAIDVTAGAPVSASYYVATSDGTLTNEVLLNAANPLPTSVGGTGITNTPPANKVLAGTGSVLNYVHSDVGSLTVSGVTTYQLLATDPYYVIVNTAIGDVDVYLPVGETDKSFFIEKVSSDANSVFVRSHASAPLDYVFNQFTGSIELGQYGQSLNLRFCDNAGGNGYNGFMWHGQREQIPADLTWGDVLITNNTSILQKFAKPVSDYQILTSRFFLSAVPFAYLPAPVGATLQGNSNTFNLTMDDPFLHYVGENATATVNVNLPKINDGTALNKPFAVFRQASGGYDVVVNTAAGDTFADGSTSKTLSSEDDGLVIMSTDRADRPYWTVLSYVRASTQTVATFSTAGTAVVGFNVVDPTGGGFTLTLPTAASSTGKTVDVKHNGTANSVIIDGDGAETIDGASTYTLTAQYQSVSIVSDGTQWFIK